MDPNTTTFEDYVGMSGAAKALGLQGMLAHYGIDIATWTQVATLWNARITADLTRFGSFGVLVEQEAMRISTGGPPRLVAPAPAASPAQAAPPAAGYPPPPGPSLEQQANVAANAIGNAAVAGFNVLGSAFGALGNAVAGVTPGARVSVLWSNGVRYPATVVQVQGTQVLVTMSDGRQLWVPSTNVAAG